MALLVFMLFAFSFSLVGAQDPDPTTLTDTQNQGGDTTSTYKLLEPLGTPNGNLTEFTTGDPCPFVRYLNIVIEIFLGICAVLAMIMIIGGGFEYVTSELPSAKGNGKARITNAVFGFIIALAGYVLLNTVNPKLLDLCPKIPQAVLTVGPDAGDGTVDSNCAAGNATYDTSVPMTAALGPAIEKLQNGWTISKINVYSNGSVQIDLMKDGQLDNSTFIGMSPGLNGFAPLGTAVSGDKKTPLGDFFINGINYTPGKAQCSQTGSNMGAAFWNLGPMTRGIGIHGNATGTLSNTNGCVRLTNADILALQPYIHNGIPVIIQ